MITKNKQFVYFSIFILMISLISCVSDQVRLRGLRSAVDNNIVGAGLRDSKKVIDFQESYFSVRQAPSLGNATPMLIPSDAIEFALTEFIKLPKSYKYFERITKAIQIGLEKDGSLIVSCKDGNEYYDFNIVYAGNDKHLVCYNNFKGDGLAPIVNSIDLSKVL
jgi:hypothetical protein